MSPELARAGGVVGAFGLALLLLGTTRERRLVGLGGWAVGMIALGLYLAPSGHHRLLAAAAVVGAVAAGVLAYLFVRRPWLLAVAVLACVPARIPVHVGLTEANLLLPLYGVVVAAALALVWELFGDDERTFELGPATWPLALLVAWSGLSIAWTRDLRQGAIALVFFWLPFGLIALSLARLPWRRRWLSILYSQLALMGAAIAAIGIYQYSARNVFWNPKVIVDNAYAPSGWFYRVNSVFYDPSIYGRFLVIGILASLVLVLRRRGDPLWAVAAALTIVIMWAGLLPSFSQSSFVALIAGVTLCAVLVWRRHSLFLIAAVILALVFAGLASPQIRHRITGKTSSSLSNVTSGRSTLATRGIKLALHHPVLGVGVGGFKRAYADLAHLRGKEPKAAASHTTPISVAAETGLPGLALFLALVVVSLGTAFRRLRDGFDANARLVFGLALTAIFVHSVFYNALFEDPTFWGLLGLIAVAARAEEPV